MPVVRIVTVLSECLCSAGMNKVDIASLMIGAEGSIVHLKLLRQSAIDPTTTQVVDVTLERRRFEISPTKD